MQSRKEKQRFAIRKYHVGVASVLIGTFFAITQAGSAQADTIAPQSNSIEQVAFKAEESNSTPTVAPNNIVSDGAVTTNVTPNSVFDENNKENIKTPVKPEVKSDNVVKSDKSEVKTEKERSAFFIYKTVYVDNQSGEQVSSEQSRSIEEKTSKPQSEKVEKVFTVSPNKVQGYSLAAGQSPTVDVKLTEGKGTLVTFKVTKNNEETSLPENTGFRDATVHVSKDLGTSNLYTTIDSNKAAYGGIGSLGLHMWPGSGDAEMGNYYIVLPKGVSVIGGLDAVQKEVDRFIATHPRVHGTAKVSDLGMNENNQQIYQVVGSDGGWVGAGGSDAVESENVNLKIQFPNADSNETTFFVNAEGKEGSYKNNILWLGMGDGTKSADTFDYYPQVSTESVQIHNAVDKFVRGPKGRVPIFYVRYFNPNVTDTYTVIDVTHPSEPKNLGVVSYSGVNQTEYDRIGLVDTTNSIAQHLDDGSSLSANSGNYKDAHLYINHGALTDKVKLQSTNAFSNKNDQEGHKYHVFIVGPNAKYDVDPNTGDIVKLTETVSIPNKTTYKANGKAKGTANTIDVVGNAGVTSVVTTFDIDPNTGGVTNVKSDTAKTKDAVDSVEGVGNIETTTKAIPQEKTYQANNQDKGTANTVITAGSDGEEQTVTTYTVNSETGVLEDGKSVTTKTKDKVDAVIGVGNIETTVTEIDFNTVYTKNTNLTSGTVQEKQAGVKGSKTIKTTYDVDPKTGELTNPKPVENIVPAKDRIVEYNDASDIMMEPIKHGIKYLPSGTDQTTTNPGEDGVKTITTTKTFDKTSEKVVSNEPTSEVTKPAKDEVVHVANVQTRTEVIEQGTKFVPSNNDQTTTDQGEDGVKTITTTSTVDPNTGDLSNPVSTEAVTKPAKDKVVHVANVKTRTEPIKYGIKYVPSGNDQTTTYQGENGVKTITTTSTVDPNTGDLSNPVDKEVITKPAKDEVVHVANVQTMTTAIKHGIKYMPSNNSETTRDQGEDGVKTITTTSTVDPNTGKLSNAVSNETITKPAKDEVVHVANVKTETKSISKEIIYQATGGAVGETTIITNGSDGEETITTIYDIDPTNGQPKDGKSTVTKTKDKVDTIKGVGNVSVDTDPITAGVVYQANGKATGEDGVIASGSDGKIIKTTTFEVDPKTGELKNGKEQITKVDKVDSKVGIGNVKIAKEDIDFTTKRIKNPSLSFGTIKEVQAGVKGVKTITTTYKVNPETGELEQPSVVENIVKPVERIIEVNDEVVTSVPTVAPTAEPKPELTIEIETKDFEHQVRENSNLPKGERRLVQQGVVGQIRNFVEVDSKGNRTLKSTEVLREPIPEITEIGTKEEVKVKKSYANNPSVEKHKTNKEVLPNTGETSSMGSGFGAMALLGGLAVVRRRKDEQ